MLPCSSPGVHCPAGARYADMIEFRTVALPSGILAHQDLLSLSAYDQAEQFLPDTVFTIVENQNRVPFDIRTKNGKGIVYTLTPLEEQQQYRLKVRAKSFDSRRRDVHYQTTFMIYISVSSFPY